MNEQLLHDALLERLRTCSDSVMLALDQNGYEDRSLLKRLEPYYLFSEWKRNYPGCSGQGNVKLNHYELNAKVAGIFKEYRSFLETGYDLVFYQQKETVLIAAFHEYCYYIEENHKKEFADLIEQYGGGDRFGDIQPEIPDFEALETI
ncbi:hypothetical protein [Zhenpiania hominis]|uniref:hypothetical protein n=1 Tax=Zhenpiania hominis TaxID=2763644 RepID=UPI0039F58F3F